MPKMILIFSISYFDKKSADWNNNKGNVDEFVWISFNFPSNYIIFNVVVIWNILEPGEFN